VQCAANKANDERTNFEIRPMKVHPNSTTKNVGDHKGRQIDNIIDQDDLRASHMPFKRAYGNRGPEPTEAYKLKGKYAESLNANRI